MAGKSAILTVKILTDASQSAKGFDEATGRLDKFQSGVSRLTPYAAGAAAALGLAGKAAVDSASRTQQAMGAVDSVFGESAGQIKAWSDTAAESVGLAKSEYGELASVIGAQLQNLGLSSEDAVGATGDLITLGSDLAATFGGTTADAVSALSAALRGEADPAERYGLSLNQTAVNAALAEKGLAGLEGEAATTAKTQTILALATEQAAGANGQFAREADTASGAAQRNAAAWENARSELGESLLPVVTQITTLFSQLAGWVQQNSTVVIALAGVLGTLAAGVLAVNAALKIWQATQLVWTAVTKGVTAAQWLLNVALNANPIGLIIAAVTLLIGGIVLLWQKNEGFRNFVTAAWKAIADAAVAAWNWIKSVVLAVVEWMMTKINQAKAVITTAWSLIRRGAETAWNGIKTAVTTVASWITTRIQTVRDTVNTVWNSIKTAGETVWNSLKNTVTTVLNAILTPINKVKSAFDAIVDAVKSVIDWIGRIKVPEINLPFGLGASSAPAAAGAPAVAGPSLMRSPTLAGALGGVGARLALGGGGSVTVINVTGTLNDTDSARAVRRVLRNDSRRRGGVVIGGRGTGVLA